MTTGSRVTQRSQQDKYGRNYREQAPIDDIAKQDTGFNLFKINSFNEDESIVEKENITIKREIKKIVLIDDRVPRERLGKKTIYLNDTISWNHSTGFGGFRRLTGKVVEIVPNNLSLNNINETVLRIRISNGAIINVRGYKLL